MKNFENKITEQVNLYCIQLMIMTKYNVYYTLSKNGKKVINPAQGTISFLNDHSM